MSESTSTRVKSKRHYVDSSDTVNIIPKLKKRKQSDNYATNDGGDVTTKVSLTKDKDATTQNTSNTPGSTHLIKSMFKWSIVKPCQANLQPISNSKQPPLKMIFRQVPKTPTVKKRARTNVKLLALTHVNNKSYEGEKSAKVLKKTEVKNL